MGGVSSRLWVLVSFLGLPEGSRTPRFLGTFATDITLMPPRTYLLDPLLGNAAFDQEQGEDLVNISQIITGSPSRTDYHRRDSGVVNRVTSIIDALLA